MIGRLTGRLDWKGTDQILLDVHGVGYVIYCSERTIAVLPPVRTPVALWTELLVREDLLQLFGFLTVQEREWHRLLTSVQGIGAKGSLAILGALGPDGIARAIAVGDVAAFKSAPGVGPKIAQRVVLELKGKAPAMMMMADGPQDPLIEVPEAAGAAAPAVAPPAPSGLAAAQAEALSALSNLGYAPTDAARAVAEAAGDAQDTPGLIRAALRRLAPGDR